MHSPYLAKHRSAIYSRQTALVVQLTPSNPFPLASQLKSAAMIQRARPRFPFLSSEVAASDQAHSD